VRALAYVCMCASAVQIHGQQIVQKMICWGCVACCYTGKEGNRGTKENKKGWREDAVKMEIIWREPACMCVYMLIDMPACCASVLYVQDVAS
jgi:hypothetical protein